MVAEQVRTSSPDLEREPVYGILPRQHSLFFSNSESLKPYKYYKYWRSVYPWHNSSSVCLDKDVLVQNTRYLERCAINADLLYLYVAKISNRPIVFDDQSHTHYRVPPSPRVGRGEAGRHDAVVIREVIVGSGNLKVSKEYDLLTLYNYWLNVERVTRGGRGSLKDFIWFAYCCIRFFPNLWERRLFLAALDVFYLVLREGSIGLGVGCRL